MPSVINPTKPFDGIPASKADLRANLAAAKQELEHGGFFKQGGVGAIERTVHGKLREFDVSVMDFGAVGDGVADDTAAIQLAINHIGTTKQIGHSRMLFRGKFKYTPASLDWSPINVTSRSVVTLYVDGTLFPHGGPVLIEPYMHLIGLGGNTGIQFQLGPCCKIQAASGQIGLWVQGSGNHTIRNVVVYGNSEPCILLTGTDNSSEATLGSQHRLENIGAIGGLNQPNSDALRVRHIFWLWVRNFSLLSNGTSGGWSINILDDEPTAIAGSGILFFEDGVIASKGIRIREDTANSTGISGNALFRNITMESARTSMFTFDTIVPVDQVTIERCDMADTIGTQYFINTVNKQAQQVVLRECPTINWTGRPPRNLIIEDYPSLYSQSTATRALSSDSSYPRRGRIQIDGEIDGRDAFRNSEMLPNMLPCVNLAARQDVSTWFNKSSHFQVTSGQAAPDGSNTAYLIEYGAGGTGSHGGQPYLANAPMTDGDYLIAGCWLKSAVAGQRAAQVPISTLTRTSGTALIDGATTQPFGSDVLLSFADVGWIISVSWYTWTGGDSAGLAWGFTITSATYSYYVWKPFLLRVDGSLHTERDVARMAARLTVVDETAKTGVLTQLPHHAFRTGLGTSGARPSASAVGQGAQWFDATLNKPIWSDGTNWRDAIGNLV